MKPAARAGRWRRRVAWMACAALLVVGCVLARRWMGPDEAVAENPPVAAASAPEGAAPPLPKDPRTLDVMAVVNGERISREDVAREALRHYGEEVLESLTNKRLIVLQCQSRGIQVTPEEVGAEIDRIAKNFRLPRDQFVKMLERERDITPEQYASDIVWPTLALRKLAAQQVEPTAEEIQKAYESNFGPAVQCRLIVCGTLEKAQQVQAQAAANPDEFGDLAKQFSEDSSAASKGLVHPIRMHVGDLGLNRAAFSLQPGQVSAVVPVANQFAILKCDAHLPPRDMPLDQVRDLLADEVRESKMRDVADDVFAEMRKTAQVINVLADPALQQQYPGAAALINGQPVSIAELADECLVRHLDEVLDGTINRRVLEQALRQQNIQISPEDIDAEIVRAAGTMGYLTRTGEPDIAGWLKHITETEGVTEAIYRQDAVWPSVALKKLVGNNVEVTDEDLKKGFDANYGPQVRCRAILFNNLRKAQEVFGLARQTPTVENFAQLAEEHSIDAGTRVLRGEIPPIRRHGGQPELEKEAFSLQPGQLSGIVQVGPEVYVLLFCEGLTTPRQVDFNEVRQLIFEDVHEKKQRVAMAQAFQKLTDAAQIDNFVTGTTKAPNKPGAQQTAAPSAIPGAPNTAPPAGGAVPTTATLPQVRQ